MTGSSQDVAFDAVRMARQNQAEIGEVLSELKTWSSDMKQKDTKIKSRDTTRAPRKVPPVRGKLMKEKAEEISKAKRLKGSDFDGWSKFDVDAACDAVDVTYEDEEASKAAIQRDERVQALREKGNAFFKRKDFEAAIETYTLALKEDPTQFPIVCNRAQAHLKLADFEAAKVDCEVVLQSQPKNTKALFRHAKATRGLGDLSASIKTLEYLLVLEPANKAVRDELQEAATVLAKQVAVDTDEVFYRMQISEIGESDEELDDPPSAAGAAPADPPSTNIHVTAAASTTSQPGTPTGRRSGPQSPRTAAVTTIEKVVSVKVPITKPLTSFEFTNVWNSIKDDPDQLFSYVSMVGGETMGEIFKFSIEAPVLSSILSILKSHFLPANMCKEALAILRGLLSVQRFDMLVMFFSRSERQALDAIFAAAGAGGDGDDIAKLRKAYGVK